MICRRAQPRRSHVIDRPHHARAAPLQGGLDVDGADSTWIKRHWHGTPEGNSYQSEYSRGQASAATGATNSTATLNMVGRLRQHASQFRHRKKHIHEYMLPRRSYGSMYSAQTNESRGGPGEPHPDRCLRFDPKTVLFTEYVLPGRCGIDGKTWIDNSTDAVTVCYVDDEGWLVRVQPRDVR